MIRILHFADAHIDIANYGRHDPQSGLPLRVLDFLKALDTIIDTAIEERVDLVIFAGDAYKDRSPAPTFQREWGRRIMRLSRAGIQTILLVGNHDLSPALGRAHALQEYETLEVANIHVIDRPALLTPEQLGGLPVQVIALPWVSRSKLIAIGKVESIEEPKVRETIEGKIKEIFDGLYKDVNINLPLVMTAHCSINGAIFSSERNIMLGSDFVLPGSLFRDPRLDYVALGHIHKAQNVNPGSHPPVWYSGSIERVDFSEKEDKGFIIAEVTRGSTTVSQRILKGRRFIDKYIDLAKYITPVNGLPDGETIYQQIISQLPLKTKLRDSILRVILTYPRDWDYLIDENRIREFAAEAFDFHLVRRPRLETRLRLPENTAIAALTPMELLDLYWKSVDMDASEVETLNQLAREILSLPEVPEENRNQP